MERAADTAQSSAEEDGLGDWPVRSRSCSPHHPQVTISLIPVPHSFPRVRTPQTHNCHISRINNTLFIYVAVHLIQVNSIDHRSFSQPVQEQIALDILFLIFKRFTEILEIVPASLLPHCRSRVPVSVSPLMRRCFCIAPFHCL
jgi:hypothetical protein